jgi:peptide/nickel transport system permease protein
VRSVPGRIGAGLVTLLVASMLIFALTAVVPGDVARTLLGREAPQAAVDARRHQLGLDESLAHQYLSWLGGFVRGDWGQSFVSGLPVRDVVMDAFARSLVLAGLTMAVLVPLALLLGVLAGVHRGSLLDRVISLGTVAGTAIPEFVSGTLLLVVFSVRLGWFPPSARSEYGARGLVLPVACLLVVTVGYVARMVRAEVALTMEQPYVQTARIKGIGSWQLVRRHVLRNSLVVPLNALGVQLRYLLAGLITVELLFSYPGIGSVLVAAAGDKDAAVLQAAAMVTGVAILATFVLTELASSWLDPRLRIVTHH